MVTEITKWCDWIIKSIFVPQIPSSHTLLPPRWRPDGKWTSARSWSRPLDGIWKCSWQIWLPLAWMIHYLLTRGHNCVMWHIEDTCVCVCVSTFKLCSEEEQWEVWGTGTSGFQWIQAVNVWIKHLCQPGTSASGSHWSKDQITLLLIGADHSPALWAWQWNHMIPSSQSEESGLAPVPINIEKMFQPLKKKNVLGFHVFIFKGLWCQL